jgi:hypothetical protein
LFLEGDGSPPDLWGFAFGLDGALRLGPHLELVTSLEASLYDGRSDRVPTGPLAQSFAAFLLARIDTHPGGRWGARIDIGPGYRWLVLPFASGGSDRYSGFEPLRLHLGPRLRAASHLDIAVLGGAGFGWFTAYGTSRACAVTASCPDSLFSSDTQSAAHFVADISFAIRGWP